VVLFNGVLGILKEMGYANVKEMWYSTHDPYTEPGEETLWLCDPHEQDDHE